MNVAVIPARGGSKRIPRKNIKPFLGRPVIGYSIEAAQKTGLFDRIIVSTDDEEIAEIAVSLGAERPFVRPPEISDDFTPMQSVLSHAVDFIVGEHGEKALDYLCCIYPTPMVSHKFMKDAFGLIKNSDADTVFAATTFPYPIFRAFKINPDGYGEMFWPEHEFTRSNDLPEAVHDAGQFYWHKGQRFIKNRIYIPKKSIPFLLPRWSVQDLDTKEDWEVAEMVHRVCEQKGLY